MKDNSYEDGKLAAKHDMDYMRFHNLIDKMPIAYDADKVVEKLKRGKFTEQETILSDTHQGFNGGIEFSIKTVKEGGIN